MKSGHARRSSGRDASPNSDRLQEGQGTRTRFYCMYGIEQPRDPG